MKRRLLTLLVTVALVGSLVGIAGLAEVQGGTPVSGGIGADTAWSSTDHASRVAWSALADQWTWTARAGSGAWSAAAEAPPAGSLPAVWGLGSYWPAFASAQPELALSDYGEGGGTISGHVYQADGETAIEAATVVIFTGEAEPLTWTSSGADGSYTTPDLPAGEYYLWALAHGCASEWYQESYSRTDAIAVQVTVPGNVPGIDFTLEPGSSISGYVRQSQDQSALEGARILAIGSDGFAYAVGWSGSDGSYATTGLLDGEYWILAQAGGHVSKWYDGAYGRHDASVLVVTEDRSGIDFVLEIGGTISGRVVDSDTAEGIADLHVNACDYETDQWVAGTSTDPDGYYTLFVPSGSYKVGAHPSVTGLNYVGKCYDDKYGWHDADRVYVAAPGDTTGIDFTLEIGGTISGRVVDSDTAEGIADLHVNACDYETDQWVAGINTDPDGYYILLAPSGSYRVGAHPSDASACYVAEYYQNTYHWHEADPVYVTAPGDTPGIDFGLEIGGTISGYVYDEYGAPITGAYVGALEYDTGYGRGGATADETGYYRIEGLPSGDYRVGAWAEGRVWRWWDDTLWHHLATAVAVTAPDETPDINFSLEPGGTISGTVRDAATGLPLANVSVECGRRDGPGGGGAGTDHNGEYTITALPFGEYEVYSPGWGRWGRGDGDYMRQQRDASICLDTPDATDVDFELEVGGSISGRVTDSDSGDGVGSADIQVILYESLAVGHWHYGWGHTDADGYYTARGLPTGEYALRVHAAGYIVQWYGGTYLQEEATPVGVTASDDTPGINFSLQVGGTISGYVRDMHTGEPIRHANIDVFGYDSLLDGRLHLAWGHTDTNGHYVTSGLPSGSYAVSVHASRYFGLWYDGVYFDREADPVWVVVPEDTEGIDFDLEPTAPRDTIEDAIADGVAWLASEQNPDGSWGAYYQVAKTALAVLKLETHAADLGMSEDPEYAYREHIDRGIGFLLSHAYVTGVSSQPAGDPDSNGNGAGVFFRSPAFPPDRGHAYDTYETSMALMAIGASTEPGRLVDTPGSVVNGWSFADVAQDVVDYLAWGQTDFGFGRGGWNYHPMDTEGERSDQSNTGWVTLGLMYAEDFGATIPHFVKSEIDIWIDYIQDKSGGPDDGGSWYTGPADPDAPIGANLLRTGNLLQQMAFVGDTEGTPRVQAAVDYLIRHWWSYPTCYHTTYTVMKGLEQLGMKTIDSLDWFQCFAYAIMNEQRGDGSWMPGGFDYAARVLSTTWALLTLQTEIPPTKMGPDLVVAEKHEEWVDEGQGTYTVHFAVKNRGNVEAPDGHHLSLVVNDVLIEEKMVPVVLAPGDTFSDSFDTIVMSALPHDRITVCADIHDAVDELNEENNCLTSYLPPAYPDLVIWEKHETWEAEGESYRVHYTVKNIGDGPAPYGHYVGLTINGVWIEHKPVSVILAAGEAHSDSFHTVITLSPFGDEIVVCADIYDQVDELDEENNCRSNLLLAEDWLVNLTLTTDPHVGTVPGKGYTFAFGAEDGATEGYDAGEGDQIAPPDAMDSVNAYFRYPGNPILERNLVTSVVGPAATIVWPLRVRSTESTDNTQATLTWNADDVDNVPAKYVRLELRDTAGNTLADMRSQASYTFYLESGSTRNFHVIAAEYVESVYQMKAGWNMISLPVHTAETSPGLLFPGHVAVYGWSAETMSYYVPAELVPGRGYWILYFEDATVPVYGVPVEQYEIEWTVAGWHMIGSLSVDAQVTVTAGSVYGMFYWWNPEMLSYEATDTVAAGRGYWLLGFTGFSISVVPVSGP